MSKLFITKGMREFNPKEVGDTALHGDVIITSIEMPANFNKMKKLDDGILALGEATGHCHQLFEGSFDLREDIKTKTKYLKVDNVVFLRHQEHVPISVPPGIYKIGIQQEYDHFEKLRRAVVD